jgi:DNA invertase Pin-like site-specific DNA recombinase
LADVGYPDRRKTNGRPFLGHGGDSPRKHSTARTANDASNACTENQSARDQNYPTVSINKFRVHADQKSFDCCTTNRNGATINKSKSFPLSEVTTVRRAAIYLRVSTDSQTTDNQEMALRDIAAKMGWDIARVYSDQGISGAKGRDKRPQFDALCKAATRREFDLVMAWSVDRLGRSLQDLIGFLSELHSLRIDLYLHQQGLDTSTPAGKAMFQLLGVFAEFERAMIQSRVKAGLARARANGRKLGRPKISLQTESDIRSALSNGNGIRKVAAALGVGVGTVQRIRKIPATVPGLVTGTFNIRRKRPKGP